MTRIDTEILLNQLAQGIESIDNGVEWFTGLDEAGERVVLQTLAYMLSQAQGVAGDVPSAIQKAGLTSTDTPCVMLEHGNLKEQLARSLQLPANELVKLFRLLVAILAVADERRRGKCGGRCTHWWHRDLQDANVLDAIKTQYTQGTL